jgi:hypothetical protein
VKTFYAVDKTKGRWGSRAFVRKVRGFHSREAALKAIGGRKGWVMTNDKRLVRECMSVVIDGQQFEVLVEGRLHYATIFASREAALRASLTEMQRRVKMYERMARECEEKASKLERAMKPATRTRRAA